MLFGLFANSVIQIHTFHVIYKIIIVLTTGIDILSLFLNEFYYATLSVLIETLQATIMSLK